MQTFVQITDTMFGFLFDELKTYRNLSSGLCIALATVMPIGMVFVVMISVSSDCCCFFYIYIYIYISTL